MFEIYKYKLIHEEKLLLLLSIEPDWNSFTDDNSIEKFKQALLNSETYIAVANGEICDYIRALVDSFGVYISELYVFPSQRNQGCGRSLLMELKEKHSDQNVYVLSDEDCYYEKLGFNRMGLIFHL